MKYKQIQKTFSLQKDLTDCGVGCLQSLIRYYGGDISLETLREKSGTAKTGTTLLGLYQCANEIGFDAEGCEADINALTEHGKPVILHVIIDEKYEHYVVFYYRDASQNNQFLIGDPAKGLEYWTDEYLLQVWKSKTCLTLEPNEGFVKASETKKEKLKWLKELIREDKEDVYIIIFLGVIVTILGMAMSIFSQILIDRILPSNNYRRLILGLVFIGWVLIIKQLIVTLRGYYIIKQSKAFNERINLKFIPPCFISQKCFLIAERLEIL